jgi:hypothetical protein
MDAMLCSDSKSQMNPHGRRQSYPQGISWPIGALPAVPGGHSGPQKTLMEPYQGIARRDHRLSRCLCRDDRGTLRRQPTRPKAASRSETRS